MNLLSLARRLDKIIEARGRVVDTHQVLIYDEHGMMRPTGQGSFTPQPEAAGLEAAFKAWGLKQPKMVVVLPDNGR